MNKLIFGLITLSTLFGLSGCFNDTVQPDVVFTYNEKLVVNTVFTDKTTMEVTVTNSSAAFDSDVPGSISDAEVKVFQNSIEHNLVYEAFDDVYENSTIVSPGDAITIEVSHPSFTRVSSVLRIPDALGATGTITPDGGLDTSGILSDLITLSFQDDATRKNFYQLNFYYKNETLNSWIPMAFSKSDPSLSEYNSVSLNDGSVLFNDELFNGNAKNLTTVAPFGLVIGNTGDKYRIEIASITEDFYRYYTTLQRARDAQEITFTGGYNNAVVIHSNINQGLGIAAGASIQEIILQ